MGIGSGSGGRTCCCGMGCLFCMSFALTIVVSIIALVGLCLAILQCLDLLLLNEDLQDLARAAVHDARLRDAYYVFIASTVIAQLVTFTGWRCREESKKKKSSCCGSVFSAALMMGNVISGLLGYVYKDETLPLMEMGMKNLLVNDSYINPDLGDPLKPRYTDIGQHFNYLQTEYKCCGVSQENAQDYQDADFTDRYQIPFPYACCLLKNDTEDHRNVNYEDVENWNRCRAFEEPFFHISTCHKYEYSWLEDKANFIILYNLCLVSVAFLSFLLLVISVCWGICKCCSCCCGGGGGEKEEDKKDIKDDVEKSLPKIDY